MGEPVLSVRDLEVVYETDRGALRAVDGASFDLFAGDSLALVGESGSGKTTLATALVRLLSSGATIRRGKIVFRSERGAELDIRTLGKEPLRRFRWQECALVFQGAQNALDPVLRIRDHFEETYDAHRQVGGRVSRRELAGRFEEVLRLVQLDAGRVLAAYPHELSGGMRQRVLLALGLLLRPRVLILDEPTTALDVIIQRGVIEMIRRLRKELRFSMIFVTHDFSLAAELADRVATMYAGKIIEIGGVDDIFFRPRHPYTLGLLRSIPTLASRRDDLEPIAGAPPDLISPARGCSFAPRCAFATQRCQESHPPLLETGSTQAACWHADQVAAAVHPSSGAEVT